MSEAATKLKKRKAGTAAGPAAVAAAASKKKLAAGIGSLLQRLEATNASFLQSAAASAVQNQLAQAAKQTVSGGRRVCWVLPHSPAGTSRWRRQIRPRQNPPRACPLRRLPRW